MLKKEEEEDEIEEDGSGEWSDDVWGEESSWEKDADDW